MPNGVPFCTRFNELFTCLPGGCVYNEPQRLAGSWKAANSSPAFNGDEFTSSATGGYSIMGAVKTDGTLWMWGSNYNGEIGDNTITLRSSPVQTISGGSNWKDIAIVSNFGSTALALKTDGTLWAWGNPICGSLGNNTSTGRVSSPVQTIAGGTNWCKITISNRGVPAAIKSDGTLWLWGRGCYGVLGDNNLVDRSSPVQTASGGTNWKAISTSFNNAVAIKTDGTLWTWGNQSNGTLGNGSTATGSRASPGQVGTGTDWRNATIHNNTVAAVKTDGTLWMWGANFFGELGNGTTVNNGSPVQTLSGGTNWRTVAPGPLTLGIKTDGTLWRWGCNPCAIFGSVGTICSPVQITSSECWSDIKITSASNQQPILGTTQDNKLFTWGTNNQGSVGIGVAPGSCFDQRFTDVGNMFVEKDYLLDVYPQLACNFKASALWGWGSNSGGRLGVNIDGATCLNFNSPTQTISGGNNWKSVSLGVQATAALKTDGTLWLWGVGVAGALGNNSTASRSSPVQTISGGTNWNQVGTGGNCRFAAIKTDGTLWLWGYNVGGMLGDNTAISRSSPVQTISGGTNWMCVNLGYNHSAAIKTDGTLWTWGNGAAGMLGNNSTTSRSSPVQTISGGTNWRTLAAGRNSTSSIKTDGTLWLWGDGFCGALGNNSTANQSSPVQTVSGGTNWKSVSMGRYRVAAIKTDGTLWLWGNTRGGIVSSPIQTVSGGTDWKCAIVPSGTNVIGLKTDGTLWGIGDNSCGLLLPPAFNTNTPTQVTCINTWKTIANSSESGNMFAIKEEGDW